MKKIFYRTRCVHAVEMDWWGCEAPACQQRSEWENSWEWHITQAGKFTLVVGSSLVYDDVVEIKEIAEKSS